MSTNQTTAPFLRRWAATVVDLVMCILICFAWGAAFKIGAGILTGQSIEHLLSYSSGNGYNNPTLFFAFLPAIVSLWYYHARMEASPKMATWGKRLLGLRVVKLNGGRLAVVQSTWRFCTKV